MRAVILGSVLLGWLGLGCGADTELSWPLASGEDVAPDGSFGGVGGSPPGSSGTAPAGRAGDLPAAWTACTDTADCMLAARTCCVSCGVATLADGIAINQGFASNVYQWLCPGVSPCPAGSACLPPTESIVAVCRGGQCQTVDIRDDSLTACNSASDCRLRWGVSCCEGCGSGDATGLVAVNAENFTPGVCGNTSAPCPACVPSPYPIGWVVRCETGHCLKGRIL
jgi:hypothetical protein